MVATSPLSITACEPDIPGSNLDSITYWMSAFKILQHLTLYFFIHNIKTMMFPSHRIVERIK